MLLFAHVKAENKLRQISSIYYFLSFQDLAFITMKDAFYLRLSQKFYVVVSIMTITTKSMRVDNQCQI